MGETAESDKSMDTISGDYQEPIPVIDWNRDKTKDRKHSGLNTTAKLGKHRYSNWVSDFVNGRDEKVEKAKLNALQITLPTSGATKGK